MEKQPEVFVDDKRKAKVELIDTWSVTTEEGKIFFCSFDTSFIPASFESDFPLFYIRDKNSEALKPTDQRSLKIHQNSDTIQEFVAMAAELELLDKLTISAKRTLITMRLEEHMTADTLRSLLEFHLARFVPLAQTVEQIGGTALTGADILSTNDQRLTRPLFSTAEAEAAAKARSVKAGQFWY